MFDDTSYRRANDAIHAPAELKERARQQSVPSSQNRKPRRWLPRAGGLVAAAVAVALLFQLSRRGRQSRFRRQLRLRRLCGGIPRCAGVGRFLRQPHGPRF